MSPAHINIVAAADRFLIEESVAQLVAEVGEAEVSRYDYSPEELEAVLSTLRSYSLFGTKQLVILRGAQKMGVEDQKSIAALPAINTLIIEVELKPQEVRKKFKTLADYIHSAQGPIYDNQLPQWIQARFAKKCRGSISRDAAVALTEFTGNQLSIIDAELENLHLFAGTKIEVADVRALLDRSAESDVFELVDAVAAQDSSRAIASLWREMRDGTEPVAIVAIVATHFIRLLEAKKSSKPPVGFYQEKLARQASAFSREKLEDIVVALTATDRRIKRESATELILEELIIYITREGKVGYAT